MVNYVTKSIFLFSLLLLSCGKAPEQKPTPTPPVIAVEPSPAPDPTIQFVPEPCPDDMVYIEQFHYCIDRYEAPNKKGEYPFYAQTAFQAENYCQSVGKRLCTHVRWNTACIGPHWKTYPYGNLYKKGTCNDDKTGWVPVPWKTMGTQQWLDWAKQQYKGEPSGNRPACVSDYGVYDMTGNVAEWVKEPANPHGFVVKGGYWYGVLQGTPTCGFVNPAHAPGFNSYEFGFRCCKGAGQ